MWSTLFSMHLCFNNNLLLLIFHKGPVDSEKTVFLQQSNTIVVTAGLYHSMEIIPKDCFGNVAIITQKYLTAEIRKASVVDKCETL